MKKKGNAAKYIFIILSAVVIVAAVVQRLYVTVQGEQWQEHHAAVERAMSETELAAVSKIETFRLAEEYTVIFGQDEDQRELIVWVGENEIHAEYASAGVSAQEVAEAVKRKDSGAEILRIVPGKLGGDWVWEVFYKKKQEKGTRHYYDYYRFSDGQLLETYTLSLIR